ncbi:MAG: hypothetical protein KGJ13_08345, partial [Patescibacteria group bacterium]|nr:hypothetical protein [Patescibacteria group bacterium]
QEMNKNALQPRMISAQEAYNAAKATARKAYEAAMAPAREAYEAAIAKAWESARLTCAVEWHIDVRRRTAEHAGVVVKFRRSPGGWVGDCQNPGVLSALLGQEEGLEIRAASFMREAGEQFTRAASSGHSRKLARFAESDIKSIMDKHRFEWRPLP